MNSIYDLDELALLKDELQETAEAEVEKVEAENKRLRLMFESTEKARFELRTKLDKAEAKLERFGPLIEAARGVDVSALETFIAMVCTPRDMWEEMRVQEIRALIVAAIPEDKP